jgi:hypothetical protein
VLVAKSANGLQHWGPFQDGDGCARRGTTRTEIACNIGENGITALKTSSLPGKAGGRDLINNCVS